MNTEVLNTNIQEFINQNLNSEIASLLLKGTNFPSVDTKAIIEQIEAKKRCEKKLPTWFNTPNIYYPNKLNIEQTSSEITAKYKSSLMSGDSLIDLTGGFGVDCFYFSKIFKTVTHCEINESLSTIVQHNYRQLGITNVETHPTNGISYLQETTKTYDWIYIDPSRRHGSKGKVFFLNDCLPNVPEHLELLFKHAKNILIKTSPLLDLSIGLDELSPVKTIHVIALNNEVKELLWVLEEGYSEKISIETINLKKEGNEVFNFNLDQEKQLGSNYSAPLTYLYEPNSAVLKAGGFHSITNRLKVFKLHKHSHLYTSHKVIDFPGRRFKIKAIAHYNKKALKKLRDSKANITTRNFPETVQQLRKKFKIKDGGNTYLFFTTDINDKKIVLVVDKL